MPFEQLLEEKIRQAICDGEFDDLPGRGKPLDLKAYFDTPEEFRLAFSVLKNARVLPEEAELLSEIGSLKAALDRATDTGEKARLKKSIQELTLKFNLRLENRKHRTAR